jgi:hypothetical protein
VRKVLAAALVTIAVATAACSAPAPGSAPKTTSTGTGTATTSGTGYTVTLQKPQPAGKTPSPIAVEVCSAKAQGLIEQVLGVQASVSGPTWTGHLYSCRYRYPGGSFVLSVKELSSWSQTRSYYKSDGRALGDTEALWNLGNAAFTTSDGSVVVRKDWKVLLVNIASLPAHFGKPPTSRADVAYTVADIILGCWAGD